MFSVQICRYPGIKRDAISLEKDRLFQQFMLRICQITFIDRALLSRQRVKEMLIPSLYLVTKAADESISANHEISFRGLPRWYVLAMGLALWFSAVLSVLGKCLSLKMDRYGFVNVVRNITDGCEVLQVSSLCNVCSRCKLGEILLITILKKQSNS